MVGRAVVRGITHKWVPLLSRWVNTVYAELEGGLFILIVTDRTRTLAQRLSSRLNREIYNLKSDDVCRVIGGGGGGGCCCCYRRNYNICEMKIMFS